MRIATMLIAAFLSAFNVEVSYAKDKPLYGGCGTKEDYYCHYDEATHTWNDRGVLRDWYVTSGRYDSPEATAWYERALRGEKVPVQKVYKLRLAIFKREHSSAEFCFAMLGVGTTRKGQRFVGINVEGGEWPEESKIWPHLGVNYVGTVANQAGYDVVLYDELVQGQKPLYEYVQEGDIVGLSLVTTGIERGVTLAHEAKALGAKYVIAGNDSAMFRARQILELPGRPIDAVFTTNSIGSLREFFSDADAAMSGAMRLAHIATRPDQVPYLSNEASGVSGERKAYTAEDFFMIPDLGLYSPEYWSLVHAAYRSQFGHKHTNPATVRNALALLAQGCGRAGAGDVCDYCTIRHVANVVLPPEGYLEEALETYRKFGINTFFNVTDSAFEMSVLADRLSKAGPVDTLVMYGRAQAIARRPDLLLKWKGCVRERLLINCGMDSGDESILQLGINKSGSKVGSRLEENRRALANIKSVGPTVHLHFSVIFGSPGETRESCESTLAFVQYAIEMLGEQLDVAESDIFWVNFGAPCSEIFTSYEAAQKRAALAGRAISRGEWQHYFARHADALAVPEESQRAWYTFFTSITIDEAWAYNARVREMVAAQVPGRISGREFAFRPPTV